MHVLDFRYVALFRDNSASKGRNRGQISDFLTPVKLRGGVGEMFESVFRATLKTQSPIYF